MVLAGALRLAGQGYGAALIREIEAATGRSVPSGSLSLTLDRLESKGLIRTRLADPDAVRGGRRKRMVEVTPAGVEAVREARAAMLGLWEGLGATLGDP